MLKHILLWTGMVLLVSIPLFLRLDKQPVRIWDEARLAMNAYEMSRDGNLLVTHFEGSPDMWNTKPPMMIWMQAACIKIFGLNEFAVRLPAAVAGLLTCVFLFWFSKRYFEDYMPGLIACLVLVTTNGYIHIHAARTGDYDALLALFTTIFCCSLFLYIEKQSARYLHLFFAALTLSVLAKGVQGLLFLPALAGYVIYRRQFIPLLKNKWLYIHMLLFLLVAGGYYVLREIFNPGYLLAVWNNELGGRYLGTLEENRQPFNYYFLQLKNWLYKTWWWLSVAGIVVGIFAGIFRMRRLTIFVALLSLTYLLFISVSQTKLEWYAVPLYPLLCWLPAMLFYRLVLYLRGPDIHPTARLALPLLMLVLVFMFPYVNIVRKVYYGREYTWDEELYPISYVLQSAHRGHASLSGHVVCYQGYNTQLLFYIRALNRQGQQIDFAEASGLRTGTLAIASEPEIKRYIETHYTYEVAREYYNTRIYKILAVKSVF